MEITKDLKNTVIFNVLLMMGISGKFQPSVKAVLYDRDSKQPVPFATIKVLHKPFGTFTNEKGNFEVEAFPTDTLLISSIGFASIKVTGPADTIFLQQVIKELPPAIVSQKHFIATHTLGIKAKADFQWGPSGYGEEFAQKIHLNLSDDEYCYIKKAIFSVKHFSADMPVLFHIYSVDPSTGLPDEELLSKKYFFLKEHFRKGKITIDISSEKLYVNDSSIFVGVEWPGYRKTGKTKTHSSTTLNMTNGITQILTYSRTLLYSSYSWFPAPQHGEKVTNTIFEIEVDKLK